MRAVGLAAVALGALTSVAPAHAHPHAWITATIAPAFDSEGRLIAVREKWAFDRDYSAGIRGLVDPDGDGRLEPGELRAALSEGGFLSWLVVRTFFTRLTVAGREVGRGPPQDVALRVINAKLVLEFTLPLADPQRISAAGVDVFDADYTFAVEFDYPDIDRSAAPANCRIDRRWAPNVDPQNPAAVASDPAEGYAVRVQIECAQ
jgi:ABC-type uncharacterized transport system substrate-binding protein